MHVGRCGVLATQNRIAQRAPLSGGVPARLACLRAPRGGCI